MNMAAQGLAFQTEQHSGGSPAPDDVNWMTQIWMNNNSSSDRLLSSTQPQNAQQAGSLPTSPTAASSTLQSQAALSASDAILNVGQLRKEPPSRTPGLQSQAGDALLQAFPEFPQQSSLKVNTAQLNAPNVLRMSQDNSSRTASPFWLRPAASPANSQGVPGGASTAQSTGVFLGAPFNSLDASATQNAQLYAQQLQQQGQSHSPLAEALHPKAVAQAAANAARAAAALQQRPAGSGSAAGNPFWVTTGYAGSTGQPAVSANPVPGYTGQVPPPQLQQLTNQRLPLHLQLNGAPQLQPRPQAYNPGLANATYIPGQGLQYTNAAHLQQRAPIAQHASEAAYLQQDPNVLAAATAAAANAAALKRTAGLPPHVQQQLLRNGHVPPRPVPGPFEANDINLAGLTPAQLQMLISSPPEQVWRLAAQMGVFKQQRRNGQVPLPVRPPVVNGFASNSSNASQANYINAMAHLHQLHGNHGQHTPSRITAASLGQTGPDTYAQQINGGLLQQQVLRAQQQQQPQINDAHRILLELGKTLASLGITVEAAINAGLLGGLAVADVHTLCDAYAAEVRRMQLTGVQPQPHLAHHFLGGQGGLKPPGGGMADLLGQPGLNPVASNPAALAAARQQALVNLQGHSALGRLAGLPAGPDISTLNLTSQEIEQLLTLRQMQLQGQPLPSNFTTGNNPVSAQAAFGSVSSAPGGNFRATSPSTALNSFRTASPSFGAAFGGTVSPAYSTHSLPAGLHVQSRPGSAFGHASIGGGSAVADPVIRRPSPNPSVASHASKPGSPRKSAQFVSNTSPTSARTFNCASYSFFGSADSRNEVTLESPHSADAAWPSKVAVAKTKSAPPTGRESSDSGPNTTPEGGVSHSEGSTKQESPVDHDLPAAFEKEKGASGQDAGGEDLGVPTDEEILMSHLNLGPGF